MTKKHLEAVAEAMRHQKPAVNDDTRSLSHTNARLYQWDRDCDALAAAMSRINPRFDFDRFRRACGQDG